MALEIPMSPIAGGVMGHYIDMYFRTEPWFTGILALAGFIHSILTIVRIARELPPSSEG
ncbi:MAG TPA: AtpZ/AtpI family protein [Candidatus Acidoferrum sp.]|nr:AtpZ/AtpI family protein [Candidatus Acidoferrum sp.]